MNQWLTSWSPYGKLYHMVKFTLWVKFPHPWSQCHQSSCLTSEYRLSSILPPDTKYMVSFPTPFLQLSDIDWVSNNSIQFWHHLPGVKVQSHKLKGSVSQDRPTVDANHKSQATRTFDWPAINWVFSQSPPLVWSFAGATHKTQDITLLTISALL